MLLCKQAEQGVPLQAEQYDWLEDTDEEVDEQELEAHYSYMAKIQEVPTADSGTDSEPVEQNDQNDVESDDERVTLAKLIANLKLDVDENKKIQKQLRKANITLAQEPKECKTILAETSKSLGESISVRDSCLVVLQTKQTEFEKYRHLMIVPLTMKNLNSLLTKSHYEGLVKQKTKVIMDLKLREEHDIEKMLSMEKQLKFLNEVLYKRSQSIQTIHMMALKVSIYNGRPTFANPRYLKQAQSKIPCLYAFPYDQNTHANRLIPDREETLALERESRSKLNKDSVRAYDYTKLNSLYEIFKPPTLEYETQLAHANEIRRKMWQKYFVKSKPNIYKNVGFLPVSKTISKSRQAYNVMTNNINHFKQIVDDAWIKHSKDQFRAPTAQDMEILIQTCLMPLASKTQNDSFRFVHELKQEMHADLKYVESFEKEIDELESDKAEFSNMYDLSKQTESVSKKAHTELLQRFAKVDKHSISFKIALQKCKEQVKNDTVCNEKASNVFRKEREQYFEIQDLKDQMQDKNIAISELKKLIEKGKGKSVDTKFDKPSVVRQPNAQRIPKPSVLGKPAPFSNSLERIYFPKTKSVPKANVSEGLSKPVTAQTLPQTAKQAVSNTNVLKPGMYRIDDRSAHTRAPQLPQTDRTTNPYVSKSIEVNHRPTVSRPQLKSNQSRDKVLQNNSQVKVKETQVEVYPRIHIVSNKMKSVTACKDNVNSRTLNANAVCATCNKCLVDSNHFACVTKMLNDVHARTKKPTIIVQLILFIVDSGYTKHMTGNLKLLCNFVEKFLGTVRFGNDQFTLIIGYGDLIQGNATPTQAWLWHQRLSHLKFDYINLLSKKDIMIGLPKLKYVKDQLCSSCELSKAKRSSFKSKAVLSLKGRLNLLHMDLCGPMRVASINGKKYVLVIVDDYSRYTWTLFLHSKDETPKIGTEFLNKTLNAFFKEERIEHQTSTARTPEQNEDADVPSQQELDMLFGYLYDKFFNTGLNPSTNIQSTSTPSTHANMHAEENDNDQAEEREQEAMADSAWIEAMQEELHQFDRLQVWELVDKSIIRLKWLWKNKKDEDQTVIRNKARLVAKGTQVFSNLSNRRENNISQWSLKEEVYVASANLRLQIHQSPRGIFINQAKYTLEILHKHGMDEGQSTDADHARRIDSRKSTSRGIQFLGDKLVSWMLKKQNCTAMSSVEAKYVALSTSYMFTKALPEDRFKYLVRRIGMRCLTPAELEILAKESA
nr:hypothetical protein [Tanacetum cinerariifolium]